MSYPKTQRKKSNLFLTVRNINFNSRIIVGLIIFTALIFFEMFNFSTTDFALRDLLGGLRFAGFRWSTTLSIAFCAIDFAGIAKLFSPQQGIGKTNETWYLFGAWLIAATMNALLTWWGVSMAIVNHTVMSTAIVDGETIIFIVPIFVAVMVWLIRILIIGSLSVTGNQLMGSSYSSSNRTKQSVYTPSSKKRASTGAMAASSGVRRSAQSQVGYVRPEQTYQDVSAGM